MQNLAASVVRRGVRRLPRTRWELVARCPDPKPRSGAEFSSQRHQSTATRAPARFPKELLQNGLPRTISARRCRVLSTTSGDGGVDDYFGLFGIPRTFGIDAKELKQAYFKLMTEHHPDKQQHNESDSDTLVTAETITHAYQTLSSPHTRAVHWLNLHGAELSEEDGNELVGMEFLMDIMERREAIEDAGSDQPQLEAIRAQSQMFQRDCETALEELLSEALVAVDDATLAEARKLTAQLQYWHRLETTLKEALEVQ